jgi:hypothetical protein
VGLQLVRGSRPCTQAPCHHHPGCCTQSNSEHSRHWFFRGDIVLDGEKMPHNLMDIVKAPLDVSNLIWEI